MKSDKYEFRWNSDILLKSLTEHKSLNSDYKCTLYKTELKEFIKRLHVQSVIQRGLHPILALDTFDFEEVYLKGTEFQLVEVADDNLESCCKKLFFDRTNRFPNYKNGILHLTVSEKTMSSPTDIVYLGKQLEKYYDLDKFVFGISNDPFDEISFKIELLLYNIT